MPSKYEIMDVLAWKPGGNPELTLNQLLEIFQRLFSWRESRSLKKELASILLQMKRQHLVKREACDDGYKYYLSEFCKRGIKKYGSPFLFPGAVKIAKRRHRTWVKNCKEANPGDYFYSFSQGKFI